MKNPIHFLPMVTLAVATLTSSAFANLNVPSDGSDGMLNIASNTVIDLGQATSGVWSSNNAGNAGNGIYDSNQWAVVFKYSSVNIDSNATVTFLNHPTHAPVIWLVESNATIDGIVNLNGQPGTNAVPQEYTPTEPGPGGFRGGAGGPTGEGSGYGPGGSLGANGSAGYAGAYGNPQILPLIGGSGASGGACVIAGSGGGGAILIVAGGTVTINGQVTAVGSGAGCFGGYNYAASSGAIRIVANQVLGSGTISASGSLGGTDGRTRIEANTLSPQLVIFPNTVAVPPGTTPVIFPPANAPTVIVTSVDTQTAPLDPLAAVAASSDIGIQNTNPVNIVLQTQNFPIQGTVSLRMTPKYGAAKILSAAYVSGDINQATWQVATILPQGFCVLQARATAP